MVIFNSYVSLPEGMFFFGVQQAIAAIAKYGQCSVEITTKKKTCHES